MTLSRLLALSLLAVALMSLVPVLVKSSSANEVTIALARVWVAVLAFSPFMWWRRAGLTTLSRKDWLQLLVIGAVFAAHWLTYFVSIKLSTPALATLAITTFGVQYPLLAYFFNGERLNGFEMLAVVCCFGGCVIVTPQLSLANETTLGVLVGLLSALLYASLPLLHQRAGHISTLPRTWAQFFFAMLCFLPLWARSEWDLAPGDWYRLLALGILCTVIAHGLWVKVTTELPALYVSMVYYLYLPSAMLTSAYFLGEEMTIRKLLGAVLVIASSVALSVYRYRRQVREGVLQ